MAFRVSQMQHAVALRHQIVMNITNHDNILRCDKYHKLMVRNLFQILEAYRITVLPAGFRKFHRKSLVMQEESMRLLQQQMSGLTPRRQGAPAVAGRADTGSIFAHMVAP